MSTTWPAITPLESVAGYVYISARVFLVQSQTNTLVSGNVQDTSAFANLISVVRY
jgi:hypothetical protein